MISNMPLLFSVLFCAFTIYVSKAQDFASQDNPSAVPPPEAENCNGIFLSYTFVSRTKEYPHLKNATAQPWAFKSTATILNAGMNVLKNWKMFVGFQNQEILVSASNAVLVGGDEFPAPVGNGTYLAGYPQTDLETSIDTAGDLTKIQAQIELSGTQFGIRPPGYPMPKTIKLVNHGFRCPAPIQRARTMHMCCAIDPKLEAKNLTTKYFPRQKGDLSISYDVIQAYQTNYLAQVTIENNNPLGRLDNWNLTWEWMRGEFIFTMRGAYTRKKDATDCIYGAAAQYYNDLDFSKVMSCEKSPIIGDLPPDRKTDQEIGNLPHCCRNGSLFPTIMNASNAISVFQMQVYKISPDLNRTALYPPQKWRILGELNPHYKCGRPLRVDDTEFPDPSGLQAVSTAVASWQIVCDITKPKNRESQCCASYSAYYYDSIIPCNTCACGCGSSEKCSKNAPALLLPPEALLVPFLNRTEKAVHWARLKKQHIPTPLPCGDNCGVSVNWHIATNYRTGWTARITLFNWKEITFKDWFVAVELKKAGSGFQNAYSFNGTLLEEVNNTIFMTGKPGLDYLMGETNGTHPETDPKIPGKQQSVISFTKKHLRGIDIVKGDGFPSRLLFNGEECTLPTNLPTADGRQYPADLVLIIWLTVMCILLTK
ncbi:COBRA-like protein 10 [Coffea arabica]|uniref:COBRA-like protein 10 n=1 Tax=Coffea arabica TaxID=13443 RepID=A0ABM4WF02_COFAR